MEPREYIRPSDYDVLLSDVGHNELVGDIAEALEVNYLKEQKEITYNPEEGIGGILYGTNARPMVNLVVSSAKFKKAINVIFMVDTGSPCIYICEKAMKAMGFDDHVPKVFSVIVSGIRGKYEAIMSPANGHYSDINFIGASFLSRIGAKFTADYDENTCVIATKKT